MSSSSHALSLLYRQSFEHITYRSLPDSRSDKCLYLSRSGMNSYTYTTDIYKLDRLWPLKPEQDRRLAPISSPLALQEWEKVWASHLDRAFTSYLLHGIKEGFRVGFNRSFPLRSAKANIRLAAEHPDVVSQYLREEVELGRVLGPFSLAEVTAASWHISKFGDT